MGRTSTSVDETDLALLHALQIHPRASWADVGRALGVSPTTAAARWRRLERAGLAWVSVHPDATSGGLVMAVIEVDCAPTQRLALAQRLAADGRILSIDEPSRGSVLLLTVMCASMADLSQLLLDELPAHPAVQSVRSSVVVETIAIGADWRLGALDPSQVAVMERARDLDRAEAAAMRRDRLPADAWSLARALLHDGRATYAELSRAVARPAPTVRRHLGALLASDVLTVRCDLAHDAVGVPLTAVFFGHVAATDLPATTAAVRAIPQLRLGLQVTGEANLVLSVFGRTPAELASLQEHVTARLPRVEIREMHVLLRSVKRVGWMLDRDGRRTGAYVVPSALRHVLDGKR